MIQTKRDRQRGLHRRREIHDEYETDDQQLAAVPRICNGLSPPSVLLSNGMGSRCRIFIQLLYQGVGYSPNFPWHLRHNRGCCPDSTLRERLHPSKRSASSGHNGGDWSCCGVNRVVVGRNAGKFRQPLISHERVWLGSL